MMIKNMSKLEWLFFKGKMVGQVELISYINEFLLDSGR